MRWRAAAGAAAVATVGAVCSGTACAYFQATGSGAGAARAAPLEAPVVVAATPAAAVLPGTTGALAMTVTNPDPVPLTVTAVSPAGPASPVDDAGCPAADDGLSVAGTEGLGLWLAPDATTTVTVPGVVTMAAAAPASCQGVTFDVPVTVTVRS